MSSTKLKKLGLVIALIFVSSFANAEEYSIPQRNDKQIDEQLQNMRNMLPTEIQSGIRWVDIKRVDDQIRYTYIVNVDSAGWSDDERVAMIGALQDFGCYQLLPAMCEGSQVIFSSGYTATTTYHDSFGNYLFDCSFTPERCRELEEEWAEE